MDKFEMVQTEYVRALNMRINLEIEAIAEMVENEKGFKWLLYPMGSHPHLSIAYKEPNLKNIAAAIRARKMPA